MAAKAIASALLGAQALLMAGGAVSAGGLPSGPGGGEVALPCTTRSSSAAGLTAGAPPGGVSLPLAAEAGAKEAAAAATAPVAASPSSAAGDDEEEDGTHKMEQSTLSPEQNPATSRSPPAPARGCTFFLVRRELHHKDVGAYVCSSTTITTCICIILLCTWCCVLVECLFRWHWTKILYRWLLHHGYRVMLLADLRTHDIIQLTVEINTAVYLFSG